MFLSETISSSISPTQIHSSAYFTTTTKQKNRTLYVKQFLFPIKT